MKSALTVPSISRAFRTFKREDIPALLLLTGMLLSSVAGTNLIFLICAGMALGYSGILWMWNGRRAPAGWTAIDLAACLFMLYSIVNSYLHNNSDNRLPLSVLMQGGIFVYYFLLSRWLTDEKNVTLIRRFLLFILLLQLGIGILQFMGILPSHHDSFRVTGPFFNPGPYAVYLATLLIVSLAFLSASAQTGTRFLVSLYLVLSGCCLIFLVALRSRSSWAGGLAGMVFVLVGCVRNRQSLLSSRIRRHITAVSAGGLLLLAIAGYASYHIKAESAKGRLLTWQVCTVMISRHPVTGIGKGNFPVSYGAAQHDLFERNNKTREEYGALAGDVRYAFNDLLQITAEEGVIGVALWGLLLTAVLYRGMSAAGAGIIVLITAGLFAYPLAVFPIQLLFWTLCAAVSAVAPPLLRRQTGPAARSLRVCKGLLSLCLGIGLCYEGGRQIQAILQWEKAVRGYLPGETAYVSYQQAGSVKTTAYAAPFAALYPRLSDNVSFLLANGYACMDDKNYDQAINVLEKARALSPDPVIYYTLGNAYEASGKYEQALRLYSYVATAIPGLLRPYYLITRVYYRKGDKKAFRLAAAATMAHPVKQPSEETENMKAEILRWLKQDQLPD